MTTTVSVLAPATPSLQTWLNQATALPSFPKQQIYLSYQTIGDNQVVVVTTSALPTPPAGKQVISYLNKQQIGSILVAVGLQSVI